jgi:uncharacterized membrane protein YuzA (DUF378 family)
LGGGATTARAAARKEEGAMERLSGFSKFVLAVAIIGALNWGLIGFFNWNLVDAIFGGGAREQTSGLSRFIYAIVGLCGLASIPLLLHRADRPAVRRPVTT